MIPRYLNYRLNRPSSIRIDRPHGPAILSALQALQALQNLGFVCKIRVSVRYMVRIHPGSFDSNNSYLLVLPAKHAVMIVMQIDEPSIDCLAAH
jgi:hypothetical protein